VTAHALFAVAPYAAAVALAALTLIRFAAVRRGHGQRELGVTLRVFRGNRLWRVGLAGTLASHVAVLFFPLLVRRWTATLPRLLAFEIASVLFGLAAAAGLATVLARHLRQRTAVTARFLADGVVLGLLTVAITSGLAMTIAHRWATSWSLVTVAPYVGSVLALRPEVGLIGTLPYLLKVHVFSALACAAVLPLSHVLDPALTVISRAASVALAPLTSTLARARARVEDAARRAGRAFWFSEEKD
jgi:nitrate reductase gamma subunit